MSTKQHVHNICIPIRWGDMDAMGHVNNTVYFRYIESARIAWLDQVGALPDPATTSEGPVIVSASCSFLKQLTYPGEIEVTTFAGSPGRSSIEVAHQIRMVDSDGQPGLLYAEGGAKVVWIDLKAEKSRPWPDRLRTLLPTV